MATPPELTGSCLVGGQSVRGEGASFSAINPATAAPMAPVYAGATARDVDRAASLAGEAFSTYGRMAGAKRAAFLRAIADGIEGIGAALIERAGAETALPAGRLQSERARTCNQLRLFADLVGNPAWLDARIDRGDPERKPLPKPDVRSLLRPLGPQVVFGASNFPLAFSVAGGDTAAALAAGCPVIVKAHPAHPGTSELVGRAIVAAAAEAGLPPGVFALLFDRDHEVGIALVSHPRIKGGSFTGSHAGGMALANVAARRPSPIPFFAEMTSVNPAFVLPRALAAKAPQIAAGLHASVNLGVGQFCTKPGLVFIVKGAEGADRFLGELTALFGRTPNEFPLTPSIGSTYAKKLGARSGGAGVRILARAPDPEKPGATTAALLAVGLKDFLRAPELAEEIFGPCGLIVECGTVGDFKAAAEALGGQLTATVWGEADELGAHAGLFDALERIAGRLIVNGWPTGVEVGHAMVHGGPYPATTDARFTSVGTRSILRFARAVAYQNFPLELLPEELRP